MTPSPRLAVLIAIAALVFVLRCDEETIVPSPEITRAQFAPFILPQAVDLRGRSMTSDVESMIATYCLPGPTAPALDAVERQAASGGWTVIQRRADRARFGAVFPDGYEIAEVRVAGSRCFTLAWLRVGGDHPAADPDATDTGEWARRWLWPDVDRVTQEMAAK
jgi:hypothetical protein